MTQQQPEIPIVSSTPDSVSEAHRFSHNAMATTFEIFIVHDDARYAQQAANAAFGELDRLEAQLSRFIENSDISRINTLVAKQPLVIGPETFECLQLCAQIYADTNGAFDVTIGSLLACWLSDDKKTTRNPSQQQLNQARRHTGMHLVKMDEDRHTVQLLTDSVRIDLGGVGKGYALDRMAKLLGHWDIDIALIHGGASSVLALKAPPAVKGWSTTLSNPHNRKQILSRLYLQYRALSGSGLRKGAHIIDPRTAEPVEGKLATWASVRDAATSDVLSTAFMVMAPKEIEQYCSNHPDTLAMLVIEGPEKDSQQGKILRFGPWKKHQLPKK
ncbi:MAG: FAD:protein FMN transferase [Planctomycetota bacterium]|jgi:thiamine biosynthesis lipoprotein